MADGNGGPLAGLQGYLDEIDRQDDEIESLRGDFIEQCVGPRAQIKEIMVSAEEAGVNMKAFRELLKKHRADRRHEQRVAGLERDDRAALDDMKQALGEFADTPLGAAAIARFEDEAAPTI